MYHHWHVFCFQLLLPRMFVILSTQIIKEKMSLFKVSCLATLIPRLACNTTYPWIPEIRTWTSLGILSFCLSYQGKVKRKKSAPFSFVSCFLVTLKKKKVLKYVETSSQSSEVAHQHFSLNWLQGASPCARNYGRYKGEFTHSLSAWDRHAQMTQQGRTW